MCFFSALLVLAHGQKSLLGFSMKILQEGENIFVLHGHLALRIGRSLCKLVSSQYDNNHMGYCMSCTNYGLCICHFYCLPLIYKKKNLPHFIAKNAAISKWWPFTRVSHTDQENSKPARCPISKGTLCHGLSAGVAGGAGSLAGEEATADALLTTQTAPIWGSTWASCGTWKASILSVR